MKLQDGSRSPAVHLQSTEQNLQQTAANHHAKGEEFAPKKSDTSVGSNKQEQVGFKALLAVEDFDINNISPKEFNNLIKDITHLSSDTGGMDESSMQGLSHFRVSLEVLMFTGQLDPNSKLNMQQYINDYTEQSERLSEQDDKTYGFTPIYANQSKQAISTYFTQSKLEHLQLEAIEFLKKGGGNLVDKKV